MVKFPQRLQDLPSNMLHKRKQGSTSDLQTPLVESGSIGKSHSDGSIINSSADAEKTPQSSVFENSLDPPLLRNPFTGEKKSSRCIIKIRRGQHLPPTTMMPLLGEAQATDRSRSENRRRLLLHRRSRRLDREVNQENPDERTQEDIPGEEQGLPEVPAAGYSGPLTFVSSSNAGATITRPMASRLRRSNLLIPDASLSAGASTFSGDNHSFALGDCNDRLHLNVAFRPRTAALAVMPNYFVN